MKTFKQHINEYGGSVTRDAKYDKEKRDDMLAFELRKAEQGLKSAQKDLSNSKKNGMPIFIKMAENELKRAKERVAEIKAAMKL